MRPGYWRVGVASLLGPGLALTLTLTDSAAAADVLVSSASSYNLPVTSLKAARFRSTVRQQYDFSCGSAAVATLLTYHYQRPTSEQQAFSGMYAGGDQARIRREGFSLLDMKRYLAELGFIADGYQLPLHKLDEAHVPAIVVINENGYHHFVVVKGLERERVLLGDPAGGTRALSRSAFEASWVGHLLFVIHGWPGPVQFNQPDEWRVAPRAVLGDAISRASLADITLFKLGSGNF
ncbi:MAG: C39 family peptidase [Sphingomonadaceae bacterium]